MGWITEPCENHEQILAIASAFFQIDVNFSQWWTFAPFPNGNERYNFNEKDSWNT